MTDIEGWGENSNNFHQQSLIGAVPWPASLSPPSTCPPPHLSQPLWTMPAVTDCANKIFFRNAKVTAVGQGGPPCLAAIPQSSSDVDLGGKGESQMLGGQVSCSPLLPMLHFYWQSKKKKQTDISGGTRAIAAACLRFGGFSEPHCRWSSGFKRGELVGWQHTKLPPDWYFSLLFFVSFSAERNIWHGCFWKERLGGPSSGLYQNHLYFLKFPDKWDLCII